MARIGHGDVVDTQAAGGAGVAAFAAVGAVAARASFAAGAPLPDFGYMFSPSPEARPGDADRLAETPQTLDQLDALGIAMGTADPGELPPENDTVLPGGQKVPAGFTYFGQFIDHDITVALEPGIAGRDSIFGDFDPLASLDVVRNGRTPLLELDSVYGPSGSPGTAVPLPVNGRMVVGPVSLVGPNQTTPPLKLVPGKSQANDLPRKGRSPTAAVDREALIGDPRNDENLIVAQLHVGFLKAHNTLVELLGSYEAAREALILMYQSAVIDDYLPRICDPAVLAEILTQGPRFFTPAGPLYMPIEFAAAGFRFGHSMIRAKYDFNLNFLDTDAAFAFTFTALQGNFLPGAAAPGTPPHLQGSDTFPHNWIIEWRHFLQLDGSTPQAARPIDARLSPILKQLRDVFGAPEAGIAAHLARRNLRRGYLFSLPTGQAVAARIGVAPMTISAESTGLGEEHADALAPFVERTPLWLYVLAEAGANGGRLGAVGTTILAETFVTLVRRSKPSIFDSHGNRVSDARHTLADILKLASLQDD